MNFFSS